MKKFKNNNDKFGVHLSHINLIFAQQRQKDINFIGLLLLYPSEKLLASYSAKFKITSSFYPQKSKLSVFQYSALEPSIFCVCSKPAGNFWKTATHMQRLPWRYLLCERFHQSNSNNEMGWRKQGSLQELSSLKFYRMILIKIQWI